MQREPASKRAVAFIDASNTRASAKRAFGDAFANFNPVALAEEVCTAQGWTLAGISYYLGVPDVRVTEDGHYTWIKRCARWRKQGVRVFTRTLLQDEQGTAREKGIDVRLALDAAGQCRDDAYDVALIFSQDQDFSELAAELRAIAREQKRWVQVVSIFPVATGGGEASKSLGGISGTIPIHLGEDEFRKVLDTPENRKRIHVPLAPRAFSRVPGTETATTPDVKATTQLLTISAAAMPSLPATQRPAPARPRGPARWARWAAVTYLMMATVTFSYLTWSDRAALTEPARALPVLADHTASALIWPAYWLGNHDLRMLETRLRTLQALLN
jgi:uncharacterized LabA/DUF88 family protein